MGELDLSPEGEFPFGPIVPSPSARQEIEVALRADESALGEVFRKLESGSTLAQVRAELGDFAWNYNRGMKAMLDGDLPTAPAVIRSSCRPFRRILRDTPTLSPETERVLRTNLSIMESRLVEADVKVVELEDARQATGEAEAQALPGVYVYSLPHYLNYPTEPTTGHTLFKVGRSDRDVIQRFRSQIRTTALPEDPVLLRIYETTGSDAARQERQFHDLLEAADHSRSKARSGGTEWFLTSLRFLDMVGSTIGLTIHRVLNPEDVE